MVLLLCAIIIITINHYHYHARYYYVLVSLCFLFLCFLRVGTSAAPRSTGKDGEAPAPPAAPHSGDPQT